MCCVARGKHETVAQRTKPKHAHVLQAVICTAECALSDQHLHAILTHG